MKSPAVIYALKIQKESDQPVAENFPQGEAFTERSRRPRMFWLLVLALTILLLITTGVYTLFAQPPEVTYTVDSTGDEPDEDPPVDPLFIW